MSTETIERVESISANRETEQFLTFFLGGEEYGVDILRVREIRGWSPVTRMPESPEFVLGVLNLRGSIVPVIDMRLRFRLKNAEYIDTTVIIVLSVESSKGNRNMGIVVDAVSDVLQVPVDDVKPSPDFGTAISTEFISGLASLESKMVMLLDIDRLLTVEEFEDLQKTQKIKEETNEADSS